MVVLVLAAAVSCGRLEEVGKAVDGGGDPRCSGLSGVANPSVAEMDAAWERLVRKDWESWFVVGNNGAVDESRFVPFTQYLQNREPDRTSPEWKNVVSSIPKGNYGRFREYFCQAYYEVLDISQKEPDEAARAVAVTANTEILRLNAEEPYFALYADGPRYCLHIPPSALSEPSKVHTLLCPDRHWN